MSLKSVVVNFELSLKIKLILLILILKVKSSFQHAIPQIALNKANKSSVDHQRAFFN